MMCGLNKTLNQAPPWWAKKTTSLQPNSNVNHMVASHDSLSAKQFSHQRATLTESDKNTLYFVWERLNPVQTFLPTDHFRWITTGHYRKPSGKLALLAITKTTDRVTERRQTIPIVHLCVLQVCLRAMSRVESPQHTIQMLKVNNKQC